MECKLRMETNSHKPVHALAIPYPGHGHTTPMMQLCKILASKGLIITFVMTNSCLKSVREAYARSGRDAFTRARDSGLDIRPVHLLSEGLPLEFSGVTGFTELAMAVDTLMETSVRQLISTLNQKDPPLSCIIADTFLPWMVGVAESFQIPLASFWTESVAVYSIYSHPHLLISNGHFPSKGPAGERDSEWIDYIPGVETLLPRDLPSCLQAKDTSAFSYDLMLRSFQAVDKADWVLANSFYQLEKQAVDAISALRPPPVWCVGPLLPSAYLDGLNPLDTEVGTNVLTETDCSQWLATKPKNSVLYVCMGSWLSVSKAQMEEIAHALLLSQQPFLWILHHNYSDMLPHGFRDNVEEQGEGLIVPWCSQIAVLSHPSVGGFLTHCGWNSTLDSVCAGVPMLAFSLYSDQHTNCKLIVDDWKIGLRLRSGEDDDKLIERCEILRAITKLFNEEEGEEMRKRAERLRDMARKTVVEGGSSNQNIESFVQGLKAHDAKPNGG